MSFSRLLFELELYRRPADRSTSAVIGAILIASGRVPKIKRGVSSFFNRVFMFFYGEGFFEFAPRFSSVPTGVCIGKRNG